MPRIKFLFYIFLVHGFSPLFGQGYEIAVSAKQLAGQQLILGEYFTSRMIPKDTVVLDNAGKGIFQGDSAFKGGLYILYFDPSHIADFLMDKNQRFTIKADTTDLLTKTEFTGSEDNRVFQEYKIYIDKQRKEVNGKVEELSKAKSQADSSRVKKEIEALNQSTENYVNDIFKEHPDLFVTTFLKAMKEVDIPKDLLVGSKREIDSIRYYYYKDHFFDNMDPADVRLLHTPLYEPRVKTYIEKVVPQLPDSLITACDLLIGKSQHDQELFRYMVITLFNYFADNKYMGMDKVYFHIAEKYYIPFATWSSPDFITKLKENLELSKPTFIGNTAPDFAMKAIPPELVRLSESDSTVKSDPHLGYTFNLSQVKSKFTLLYFWEADCGHCQQTTPELQEIYGRIRSKGVEVLSCHVINSVEGKVLWMDFLNKHEMYDWVNCWSPYNNDFRKIYNLQSFPQLFLLDKDKKIIAKKLTPQQAEEIINKLSEIETKENKPE